MLADSQFRKSVIEGSCETLYPIPYLSIQRAAYTGRKLLKTCDEDVEVQLSTVDGCWQGYRQGRKDWPFSKGLLATGSLAMLPWVYGQRKSDFVVVCISFFFSPFVVCLSVCFQDNILHCSSGWPLYSLSHYVAQACLSAILPQPLECWT